ncbi:hypothetical protein [Halomonas litopenaei]|uniref:hypothetical protein n=1 Tax=Halomonas litopenaei TaxID=2109328 RepID=UPI003F9F275C
MMNITKKEMYKATAVVDDTDEIYSLSKDYRHLNRSGAPKFSKPKYQLIKALISKISYENVVEIEVKELCEMLGTDRSNLHRRLNIAGSLIEYESCRDNKAIEKGQCRIHINPNYAWKVSYTKSREQAIKEWYLFKDLSEESKTDFSINPAYVALKDLKVS